MKPFLPLVLLGSGCALLGTQRTVDTEAAYRTLLAGDGGRNEYGWICEYSTAGHPPPQRRAVLTLLARRRTDLLQAALRSANVESRVYAADALLYLEHRGATLMEPDRRLIGVLRAGGDSVRTCGNAGSYRIQSLPVREVLSDSAVAEIPVNYQLLTELGW